MSCKAGYPHSPCPFDFKGRVTRETCGACKYYAPPAHILAWCLLWDREKILCRLPKSSCEKCPERYRGPHLNQAMAKVDWSNRDAVRAYYRAEYKRDPSKANERMLRFLEKDPDYFKTYRRNHREKMNAAALRYYHKKKGTPQQ